MAEGSHTPAVIDTSVLLNFIALDRADLLARHPKHRFIITDHVRVEVTDRRPERFARFEKAVDDKVFDLVSVSDPAELTVFGRLIAEGRLDVGESAAAAHAIVRGIPLATDDRRAKKILARFEPALVILDTESTMRDLIAGRVITVSEANVMKLDWETNHRFRLPFPSF